MSRADATGTPPRRDRSRVALWTLALAVVLVAVAAASVMRGGPNLDPRELVETLGGGGPRLDHILVLELRLPRLVLAIVAGACLGVTGVLLQDGLRNPLAGPELLGVSAGAGIVMAAIIVFALPVPYVLRPWAALLGGLVAGGFVLAVTLSASDPVRTVLLGAAVSAMLSAGVAGIVALGEDLQAQLLFSYLLGSLSGQTWDDVRLLAPFAAIGLVLAMASWRRLNLMRLDDDVAEGLGLNVVRMRVFLLALSAVLVGAVAAVAGPIPYVALLAPHVVRRALRTVDARVVLPASALLGATLLPAADLLARLAFSPLEVPVGVWLTLLGVPVFLWVMHLQERAARA